MPTVTTLGVFTAAALALLVVPGPAVLYVISRSVDEGRLAGVVRVLGVGAGSMVHVLAAVTGLSALLASSSTAFTIVKYLGAAYLVWLGVRVLRSRDRAVPPEPNQRFVLRDQAVAAGAEATSDSRRAESDRSAPLGRAFRQGAIVQVLNPKVALFFLAFLPQFVDPAVGPSAAQIALLGAVFVVLALLTDAMYALLAGTLGDWLRRSSSARRGLRRVSGAVYIGLGATAAVSGSRPSQ
jgi:threonine/homoserine/homoserine lactone efflux protein